MPDIKSNALNATQASNNKDTPVLKGAPVIFDTYDTKDGHLIAEIMLNAPKSLNAISALMCQMICEQLAIWRDDTRITAVLIRGAGDKAFCAGGDIRKLYESMVERQADPQSEPTSQSETTPELDTLAEFEPNPYATEFFGSEYLMHEQMHFYNKPLVLWGNGIIMGGGMGLLAAATHRIVTETTKFAMPEINIGLFPDASGSWFLQRLPAKTGLFLGLTGAICNANDALVSNLAQYAMPSHAYKQVVEALTSADWSQVTKNKSTDQIDSNSIALQATQTAVNPYAIVSRSLAKLRQQQQEPQSAVLFAPSHLTKYWYTIETMMTYGGLEDIDALLKDDARISEIDIDFVADEWAGRALNNYRKGCPVTAVLAYELHHRARNLSLEQVLYLEMNVAVHCAGNPDFAEGVRALLIDKDKNPKWSHTMAECLSTEGQAYIANHFESPYPKGEHIFDDWLGNRSHAATLVQGKQRLNKT